MVLIPRFQSQIRPLDLSNELGQLAQTFAGLRQERFRAAEIRKRDAAIRDKKEAQGRLRSAMTQAIQGNPQTLIDEFPEEFQDFQSQQSKQGTAAQKHLAVQRGRALNVRSKFISQILNAKTLPEARQLRQRFSKTLTSMSGHLRSQDIFGQGEQLFGGLELPEIPSGRDIEVMVRGRQFSGDTPKDTAQFTRESLTKPFTDAQLDNDSQLALLREPSQVGAPEEVRPGNDPTKLGLQRFAASEQAAGTPGAENFAVDQRAAFAHNAPKAQAMIEQARRDINEEKVRGRVREAEAPIRLQSDLTRQQEGTAQKNVLRSQSQLDELDAIEALLRPELFNKMRQAGLKIGETFESFFGPGALESIAPGTGDAIVEQATAETMLGRLFDFYRKDITGAQAAEKELERLQKNFPNLRTMSWSRFRGAMTGLKSNLERVVRASKRALQAGIDLNTPEGEAQLQGMLADKSKKFVGTKDEVARALAEMEGLGEGDKLRLLRRRGLIDDDAFIRGRRLLREQ